VFIPKYRRKALYGELRQHLGAVFHDLAQQRESKIEQGNLVIDHVPMLISIPPKYSLAQVIGFIKGKSAIHVARTYVGRRKNFTGHHFWARGYFVSTVGADEASIREYIRDQERGGQTARPNEPVLNHQHTASSGSPHEASGFAGGYLLHRSLRSEGNWRGVARRPPQEFA
jgi:putative transposase